MNSKTTFSQAPFHLWGILNCTPDSFYDGSSDETEQRVEKALAMVEEGAEIIDIGGESTRPGAEAVSAQKEIDRVLPTIEGLRKGSDVLISIDTSKADVAEASLQAGANIVNDVTAGMDPKMAPLLAKCRVPIVLMHMQGTPRSMQKNPIYEDVASEVLHHLEKRRNIFMDAGVSKENILFDPGIGFGKKLDHNLQLMANLGPLQQTAPVLLGVSRKSFISGVDPSAPNPENRLPGSLAPLAIALTCGVQHFRVHDVSATRQFLLVIQHLLEKSP